MKPKTRHAEMGGARLKFLVVIIVLGAISYAGYQYIPVAYNAYLFRDLMQQKVNAAVALGYPPTWVKDQLLKSAPEYKLPPDLEITPEVQGQRMEVRAQFNQPIEFPGYTYNYSFDHTAKSTDFLMK